MCRTVFLDRSNRNNAIETMQKAADTLKAQNTAIWLYPEGTRSHQRDNSLLPFKKGAFHLALSGQMPVVPIVISTYGDVYDEKRMRFEGGNVKIKILDPIETKGMTNQDIDVLIDRVRNAMLKTLNEMSTTDDPLSSTIDQHTIYKTKSD